MNFILKLKYEGIGYHLKSQDFQILNKTIFIEHILSKISTFWNVFQENSYFCYTCHVHCLTFSRQTHFSNVPYCLKEYIFTVEKLSFISASGEIDTTIM